MTKIVDQLAPLLHQRAGTLVRRSTAFSPRIATRAFSAFSPVLE